MSPLKRKSPDASPDASGDDAPNKRLKTEDEHAGQNGANKQENPFPSPQQSRAYDSRSPRRESVASLPERDRSSRSSFSQEEKKRGKRLFGGLLNTLSQTTSNSQQKRRQEVEKRQQERAAKQRTEDDNRRSERLAKLDKIRRVEQVRFDEQVMRTRHSSMRSMAHSLQSKSEPKLYYRPWQLTPEQETTIKNQIRDVDAQVEDEVRHFEQHKDKRLRELGASASSNASTGELVEDCSNMAAKDESATAASATNDRKVTSPAPESKSHRHEDKDHDEMVEAEEDTVIY